MTRSRFGFLPYLAITRNALAQSDAVQGAPGRTMVLSRVKVEPGAQLATHHHLGTQISRVTAGVLTYTVRRGSAVLRRGEADQNPQLVRTIHAGQTARVQVATLLKSGAPPSTPVTLDPTSP